MLYKFIFIYHNVYCVRYFSLQQFYVPDGVLSLIQLIINVWLLMEGLPNNLHSMMCCHKSSYYDQPTQQKILLQFTWRKAVVIFVKYSS